MEVIKSYQAVVVDPSKRPVVLVEGSDGIGMGADLGDKLSEYTMEKGWELPPGSVVEFKKVTKVGRIRFVKKLGTRHI